MSTGFTDPDAQAGAAAQRAAAAKAAADTATRAASRRTIAANTPRRSGPNDPANNPALYTWRPGVETNGNWYQGSAYAPGFDPHQGPSMDDYKTWLAGLKDDPNQAPMLKAFGDKYIAFSWFAQRTNMDTNVFLNSLSQNFPGWRDLSSTSNGPGGGGRRGGGGGGGGGGMSVAEQTAAAEAAIRNKSETFGMALSDADIHAIAGTVVKDNWSGDQLDDYLLGDPNAITKPGTVMDMRNSIKEMGKAQLITVSDETAADWAKRIMSGDMQQATVGTILQDQAKAEFGWATDSLKTGSSMADILAPTRDTIARELEISPSNINLMDDKWRKMVQTTNADGTSRLATMTEATRAARQDSQYANTAGAARMAAQTASMVRSIFEGN